MFAILLRIMLMLKHQFDRINVWLVVMYRIRYTDFITYTEWHEIFYQNMNELVCVVLKYTT